MMHETIRTKNIRKILAHFWDSGTEISSVVKYKLFGELQNILEPSFVTSSDRLLLQEESRVTEILDPPYHTGRHLGNSEHDYFSMEEMVGLVKLSYTVMRRGGHAHLFCFSTKFRTWVRTFRIAKENVQCLRGGWDKETIQLEVFQCEKTALVYLKVPGTWNYDPRLKILGNMTVMDNTVHFFRESLPNAGMFRKVYYQDGPSYVVLRWFGMMSVTVS